MNAKLLPLKAGWQCFFDGWALFKAHYIKFIIGTAIWLAIELVIAFIPVAGPMIDGFLFPLFYAGFLNFAFEASHEKDPKIMSFFKPITELKLLLQFSLLGMVIVGFELLAISISSVMSFSVLLPLALVMVSALIFSVPLILFDQILFHQALKLSVETCGKNFVVLIVIYFVLMGLMILSALTFGVVLIAVIPVVFCALYIIYTLAFQIDKGEDKERFRPKQAH